LLLKKKFGSEIKALFFLNYRVKYTVLYSCKHILIFAFVLKTEEVKTIHRILKRQSLL